MSRPSGVNLRLLTLESLTGSSRTVKPGVSTLTFVWAELAKTESTQAAKINARTMVNRIKQTLREARMRRLQGYGFFSRASSSFCQSKSGEGPV